MAHSAQQTKTLTMWMYCTISTRNITGLLKGRNAEWLLSNSTNEQCVKASVYLCDAHVLATTALLTWAVLLFWLERDLRLDVMPIFSPFSKEWTTLSRKVICTIEGSTFWGSSTYRQEWETVRKQYTVSLSAWIQATSINAFENGWV